MLGLAGYYAIFVVSTQFLSEVFHASTAVAGLATGIIVIGCLVGRFFTGSIVHSAGYRRVLFCGVVLYLLTNAAYFFADTLALIFLVRFVSGVAVGIVGTVTGTIVAVVVPSQFHGRGIAYFSMSTALALCFGPFIGIALVDSLGYEGIFAIGTAMACVNLLLVPFVKVTAQRKLDHHKLTLADFIEPKLIPFSLFVCVVCLAWGNIQAFMAAYARAFDVVAAASSFFLVYAIAILLSRPFSGKIYDAHGAPIILYPSLILLTASLALLWGVHEGWSVLLAGALAGLGFGNFQSVAQVSAISMVTRERYARALRASHQHLLHFLRFGTGSCAVFGRPCRTFCRLRRHLRPQRRCCCAVYRVVWSAARHRETLKAPVSGTSRGPVQNGSVGSDCPVTA